MKLHSLITISTAAISLVGGLGAPVQAAPTTPSRVSSWDLSRIPYQTSGIVWNQFGRGSGTVAFDTHIVVGCAHVSFNNGAFLSANEWHAAYDSANHPGSAPGRQALRGYRAWTGYRGGTAAEQFHLDFMVHFAYAPLAGGWKAGLIYYDNISSHALTSSSTSKLIIGYPGTDPYYMNSVGVFTSAYTQRHGHYLWNPSVKGGRGISGGGVFSFFQNHWCLAGVHVSGDANGGMGAGVRAIDSQAFALVNSAIQAARANPTAPTTRSFQSTFPIRVPDNSASWTVRDLAVSGMPSNLIDARLSLTVAHQRQGDLQAVLVSPSGRAVTLQNRTGGAGSLVISQRSLASSFAGSNPNGNWRLMVRDLVPRNAGTIGTMTLEVSAR